MYLLNGKCVSVCREKQTRINYIFTLQIAGHPALRGPRCHVDGSAPVSEKRERESSLSIGT